MANSFEEMREWAEVLRKNSSVTQENNLIEQVRL
jgi:hypothetical protein